MMKLGSWRRTLVWGTEDWVASARPSASSVIADGPLRGRPFADARPDFPLLCKVIETSSSLSVQVHPNERTALRTGGQPKTEMWCVLRAGPIYAGLRPGTTRTSLAEAFSEGRVEDVLLRHDARPFDVFFIPGGLVHAIGGGTKVYEVQQSSDTTFRFYDWGRVGLDGRPRELHVDKAFEAIDFSIPSPAPLRSVSCPFFSFDQRVFGSRVDFSAPGDSFLVAYEVETGEVTYLDPGGRAKLGPGRVFLTCLP